MHLSKYTVFYSINKNKCAMFNTLRGTLVVIPHSTYEILQRDFDDADLDKLFGDKKRFILDNFCTNDNNDVKELRELLLKNRKSKSRLTITILTTLACNLSCVYCYQQGLVDRSLNMSEAVAVKIKEWIINKIRSNKPKEIIFHFYGGEPLINIDVLDTIMPEIMIVADEYGAKFTSYITTNGVLLTKENIKKLKNWNLDNAQISIDGPKLIHDQRRVYTDGRGTYDIIMNNVEIALQNNIHVVVRVNVDKHNLNYVEEFFKEMRDRGLNQYNSLQVNIEIVSPIMNPSNHCLKYTFKSDDEMKTLAGLWKLQVEYGFPIKSAMPIDSACENQVENSYTFAANGDLYMCPGFIGIDELKIGNILDDDINVKKYKSLIETDIWEECVECEYVPVCQGGCRMCAYVTRHEFGKTYCRKEFITTIYPEFIKSKYSLYKSKGDNQ